MHIMIIIPSVGYGGAESLVLSWIQYWLKSETMKKVTLVLYQSSFLHRLETISKSPKFQLVFEKTNTPWRLFRGRNIVHLWNLRKIILKEKPDIIQTNLSAALDLSFLIHTIPKVKRIIHVYHFPANQEKEFYKFFLQPFYKNKRCLVVGISNSVCDSIKIRYHIMPRLIYNGANVPQETEKKENVATEIKQYELQNSSNPKRIFIAVGSVSYPKNHRLMTNVFRRLFHEKYPVMLVVVGDLLNDDNRKNYLPLKSENIFFLDKKDNVGDYLRCAEFFCMTSHFEGLPMSAIEAISVGLIPVITPTNGLLEVIPSQDNGVISEEKTEESYYKAILRALSLSDSEKNEIRKRNYLRYNELFTMSKSSEEYLKLFLDAVK